MITRHAATFLWVAIGAAVIANLMVPQGSRQGMPFLTLFLGVVLIAWALLDDWSQSVSGDPA